MRAKAFDALRGLLPAGATSNLGIYASGQAYEALLIRMRAHPLPEARSYADLMLTELRKVIPSWVKRVDVDDRGQAHSQYLERNDQRMQQLAGALFGDSRGLSRPAPGERPAGGDPVVTLLDWDPDAEVKVVAAMLYPYTHLPEHRIQERVAAMSEQERLAVVRAYVGERGNRRHRPGRALERGDYRFDILSDYGAFRDLQRHRLLTVEWQDLTPAHGYTMPRAVAEAGGAATYGPPWPVRPGSTTPWTGSSGDPGGLCGGPGLPHPLRDAVQRPGGHAPHRVADQHPGPSRVPQGVPADAPVDPREGRSSRHRRPDDLHGCE